MGRRTHYPDPFTLDDYLSRFDPRLLEDAEGRRILTRLDPALFTLVYLANHLKSEETGGAVSFSDFHLDVFDDARRLARGLTEPQADRAAYIAPRGAGKSTLLFLALPLWLAAHGHRRFVAAFADAGTQAELHLQTFKRELETNELLRQDFPDLCTPARRKQGSTAADNRAMYQAANGFVFAAKGIDASSLGMKVGDRRPDHLVFDDVEPDASNYSAGQKEKRLATILKAVLPLNVYASATLAGTMSMPGCIVHDLVDAANGLPHPEWVDEEKWHAYHYRAIITDPVTGVERSLWPEKWSLAWMNTVRHTRAFRSQMNNEPDAFEGAYWTDSDFRYGTLERPTAQVLSIDPAVTTKEKSDYTALALVAYDRHSDRACVLNVWNRRIPPGEPLRELVLAILDEYPQTLGVLVESNQGGDTWRTILHGLPVRLDAVHQTAAKELRAEHLLNHYQRGRVLHAQRIPALENQMLAFPGGAFDDCIDAVGTAVEALRPRPKRGSANVRTASYV